MGRGDPPGLRERPDIGDVADRAAGSDLGRRAVGAVRRTTATRSGWTGDLGPHCLRHSYASHLLEDGFDHLFVQQQLGHAWRSTTAIYTTVGSDYKNRALRRALDRAFEETP